MSNPAELLTRNADAQLVVNTTLVETVNADLLNAVLVHVQSNYNEALDTIWMILAALLVFFMHAGFSLLETGSVRLKNTQNIMAKNLIVVTVGFLCWYVLGWGLAYGGGDNEFAGNTQFVTHGFSEDKSLHRQWFFQGAFCATGATIVSGAMAERTTLKAFVIFVCVMTSIIYPIVVYWGWSGAGFLSNIGPGFVDFAGSGIVHMVGGVAALCGSILVGARKGRFESGDAGDPDGFEAHNVPFCVVGTFFLWFGWYGFNPGSTLAMHDADAAHAAGVVAVNTTLAPCMGGLVVFLLRAWVCPPKALDVCGFCNGILAGLVSITAGCHAVYPWEACLIGFIGGCVYQGASMLLKRLKIDDVVDAFPVHGACGCWGVLSLGFFGGPDTGGNGVLWGGNQLGVQVVAILIIAVWSAALSCAVFVPLKLAGALRLTDDTQMKGADLVEHSPPKAYEVKEKV